MLIYVLLAGLTCLFYVIYLGLYLPKKANTIEVMRKRLNTYDNGKYAYMVSYMPGERLYKELIIMVLLATIFWPIDWLAFLVYLTKKMY